MLAFYLTLTADESDGQKFEKIYNRYKRLMLSAAYEILGDTSLSEDAVHEAFIRILKNLDKVGEVDSPRTKGFVMIVTENVAKTMYRKRSKMQVVELSDELPQADDIADRVEGEMTAEYLASLIARLPERLRQVMLLKTLHNLSDNEVASALGISGSAVRKRLQRAREQLRTMMGGKMDG